MSPPGPMAPLARPGVSASPSLTVQELKDFACLVLDNIGISPLRYGVNRINKIAVRYQARAPHGTFELFFLYLSDHVFEMTAAQRQRALSNPDIYRRISYSDPTGEDVVNPIVQDGHRVSRMSRSVYRER
jgi:hypothetical protein